MCNRLELIKLEAISTNNCEIRTESYPSVQIQYFGSVREAARKKGESIEISTDITAYQLLQRLAGIHGEDFQGEIFQKGGKLRDDFTVTVNNAIINHLSLAETNIKPGDVISLFPVFPGGG